MSSSSLSLWHLSAFAMALLMLAHLSAYQNVAVASLAAQSDLLPQQQSNDATTDAIVINDKIEDAIAQTPGQIVIAAIPKEERAAFIMYQLAKALNIKNNTKNTTISTNSTDISNRQINPRFLFDAFLVPNDVLVFEDISIYEEFPIDLLNWITGYLDITEYDIYRSLRARTTLLCTSNGVCFSREDIGCMCCPF